MLCNKNKLHTFCLFLVIRRLKHFLVSLACPSPTTTTTTCVPLHHHTGDEKERNGFESISRRDCDIIRQFYYGAEYSEETHAENGFLTNNVSEIVPKKEFCDKRNNNNIYVESFLWSAI